MQKVYLSTIGIGNYKECIYEYQGHKSSSLFAQEAILNDLKASGEQFDRILCFMTKQAEIENWLEYTRGDGNEHPFIKEEGLCSRIKKVYLDSCIEIERIPDGKNENELLEIFKKMFEALKMEDEVTMDVTYGFRSLPMLFIPVINYAEVLKNIKLKQILYGALQAGIKDEASGKIVAPVFDLTIFQSIIEWGMGAKLFARYGTADHIKELSRESSEDKNGQMSSFSKCLGDLTDSIQTARGNCQSATGGISGAFLNLAEAKKAIGSNSESKSTLTYFLSPMLDYIMGSIKNFDIKTDDINERNLRTGMATVEWCIDKKMIQQGFTALEETIVTFFMFEFSLSSTERYKAEALAALCQQLFRYSGNNESSYIQGTTEFGSAILNGEKKQLEYRYNERTRNFKFQGLPSGISDDVGQINCIISFLKSAILTIPFKLSVVINNTKELRNDINHFGMRDNAVSAEELQIKLNECYNSFKAVYAMH